MKQKNKSEAAPASGQYTPGPWVIAMNSNGNLYIQPEGRGHETDIAFIFRPYPQVGDHSPIEARREANARLIAAAPELLEALRRIYNNAQSRLFNSDTGAGHPDFDALYCICQESRAAIAKAEGRGQ